MESLYTVLVIAALFVLAVVYVCIRIASITSGQDLEVVVSLGSPTRPNLKKNIEELESRLARLQELPTEDCEPVRPAATVSHCVHCEAEVGRLRSEVKQTHEALYPHLHSSNYLMNHGN